MIKQNHAGFTLIELLIIMAIMGILTAVSFITMNEFKDKARDGHRLAEVGQISKALEVYYAQYGHYPYFNDPNYINFPNNNWQKKELAAIWGGVLDELYNANLIQQNPVYDTNGINISIQDPSYEESSSNNSYEYMPSKNIDWPITEPQNFRIRVELQHANNKSLFTSLIGSFLYSDKDKGKYACDPNQGYYCIGPSGYFNPFKPKHNPI